MLAEAYEYDEEDNQKLKIFCLDPSSPAPKTTIWNSYIDAQYLRKPSTYVNHNPCCEPYKCRVTD